MSAKHTLSIPADVADVLYQSTIEDRFEDNCVALTLPSGQLERKLYTNVMKVLSEFGGRWSKRDNAILMDPGSSDKLQEALNTGTVKRAKVIRQAYYTPAPVAEELVQFGKEVLPALEFTTILEPSAGEGALVAAVDAIFDVNHIVLAFEIDSGAYTILREKLEEWARNCNFLAQKPQEWGLFNFIVMNPPFQKGQALKHINHALGFLYNDGVLVAIVPANFQEDFPGLSVEYRNIPAGAFKESGTNIATKMLRIKHLY
jgi:predicted RNA methylase